MSAEEQIHDFVSRLQPGEVRVLAGSAPVEAIALLEQYFAMGAPRTRLVSQCFSSLPPLSQLIDQWVQGLGQAALELWPDWYGAGLSPVSEVLVIPPWREQAQRLASHARPPLPEGFLPAVDAQQLALTLSAQDLVIALSFSGPQPTPAQLTGLAAAASWLAEQTAAKIALVIPEDCWPSPELARLLHGGVLMVAADSPGPAEKEPGISQHEGKADSVRVTPVTGRPHPLSPGEIKLAGRLSTDPLLGKLFHFNPLVRTVHLKEYRVDLLWPEGKLIVEIDGYGFHSSRFSFTADRHRDYELLISGYRVLRLTNDEVVKDVERAIAKIRDSVEFVRKLPP